VGSDPTFLKKGCKKLSRRQDEAAALKAYTEIFLVFCNIHTQTGYYKKGINHLVENFLSCNITKYY